MADRPLTLTVPEVAEHLRLHRATVYGLIQAGEIPVIKIGRATRVLREHLDAYLAEQATVAAVEASELRTRLELERLSALSGPGKPGRTGRG